MLCKELMKTDVECVSPNDSAQSAARRMRQANVGFLPICDEGGKVIGTVTMPVAIVGVVLMQLLRTEARPLVPALHPDELALSFIYGLLTAGTFGWLWPR